MRFARRLFGIGLASAMLTSVLWADEVRQPVSFTTAAFRTIPMGEPAASESPSDLPAYVEPEVAPATESAGTCCTACQCCKRRCGGCCLGDPWTLPQPCLLQKCGIRVGGWLQQGITFNSHDPVNHFNGPVATNDLDGEYQMNQFWLYLDRQADTGGCGWAVGGHIDMLYGTDWRFGINHGLEDRINGFNRQTYGIVIPQMYAEVAWNDLSVKIGHFAAILDYEVVPAPFNPFYSHSYSYGYMVPQLVTGVLGDYKLNDCLSVQLGFHRGWMMYEDFNDDLDVMAGVKWANPCTKNSLAFAISSGPQDPAGDNNRFVYSLVGQLQLTQKLRYVAVHNLGQEENTGLGGTDANWYGLNQYLLYTINPCWSANLRIEWLRDEDGARIAGPGNIPGVRAWDGRGFVGDFTALTCGASWRANANLTIRPEVRWDWYDGQPGPPGVGMPFNDGRSADQFLFAVDAIFTF